MKRGFVIVSNNWTEQGNFRPGPSDSHGTVLVDSEGRDVLGYGSQYLNSTMDRLYTHLAVIGDYVASCITLVSPSRVPAGKAYHVSMCLSLILV